MNEFGGWESLQDGDWTFPGSASNQQSWLFEGIQWQRGGFPTVVHED